MRMVFLPYVRTRLWVLLLCVVIFVPWGDLTLWRYVYGFIGDLTPATWIILFTWLGFPDAFRFWVQSEFPKPRQIGLLIAMVLFYVFSLGSGPFDPYAYGYEPWAILTVLSVWAVWRGRLIMPAMTLLFGMDLAIYALSGLASNNLWDYLLDPVLMIVLCISVFRGVMSRRFKSSAQV